MKTYIFKLLVSFFVLTAGINSAIASTYVSLSPVFTEIIYAINAQDNLKGVSSLCNYPPEAKQKPVAGGTYYVNSEIMIQLKPDYIFALDSAKPKLKELYLTSAKPVYFDFSDIDDIYSAIEKIGEITEKEENAQRLINDIKSKINNNKTSNPKKILFLLQTNPEITIGKGSFITDIIKKSGHSSVSENIKYAYPELSLEYLITKQPDIIISAFPSDTSHIKKLFPKTKIIYLTQEELDIIMRPGPRVYEAVKIFAQIGAKSKI